MEKISRRTGWPTAKPNVAMGNAHGKRERYRPWLEAKITAVFEPQSVDHSLSPRGSCHPPGFQLSRCTDWPTAKFNLAMGHAHGQMNMISALAESQDHRRFRTPACRVFTVALWLVSFPRLSTIATHSLANGQFQPSHGRRPWKMGTILALAESQDHRR